MFEVQVRQYGGVWVNEVRQYDDELVQFNTYEDAEQELKEFFGDMKYVGMPFRGMDYRIQEVNNEETTDQQG